MSDPARQWLMERASLPGTLACALRRPDGKFVSHSLDATCPVSLIERVLGNFDALAAAGAVATDAPQWSTWAFEQGQVRLMQRPDGWRLALITRNEAEAVAGLDLLSQEFLTCELGD